MKINVVCFPSLFLFVLYSFQIVQAQELKWKFRTSYSITSTPAIDKNGTIYFGGCDLYNWADKVCKRGALYSIDRHGKLKWKFETKNIIYSPPVVSPNGDIHFLVDAFLYAVTKHGKLKWVFNSETTTKESTFLSLSPDKRIYFIGCNHFEGPVCLTGALFSLTLSGELKWKFEINDMTISSPSVGQDGAIYFGGCNYYDFTTYTCREGVVYALTPDGKEKWNFKTKHDVTTTSLTISSDGTIYFGTKDFWLYALTKDGQIKWKSKMEEEIYSAPSLSSKGNIYFCVFDYYCYSITNKGKVRWEILLDDWINTSPCISTSGMIFFGGKNLYAVTSRGKLKWKFKPSNDVSSSPVLSADGTIYFGSDDGYLYAIKTASKGLAKSSWPKFRGNAQNTGTVQQ